MWITYNSARLICARATISPEELLSNIAVVEAIAKNAAS